jgi:uncharacterized protein (DUF1800 family)
MNTDFHNLDPNWAWSPYESSDEQPWDDRRAAHLFRRAGWGATRAELDRAVQRRPLDVVADLLEVAEDGGEERAEFESESSDIARAMLATGNPENLVPWWLHRMRFSPAPLVEKMTLFWHGHFATSAAKVTDAGLMFRQNQMFRRLALGDFRELVHEVSHDPAMLTYLDSDRNRKAHPNENYARELMELFCLGEGNYSEADVQQLARCFTGTEVRRGQYYFNRYQHDPKTKHVLGRSGSFDSREGVQIVLEHPGVAEFIVAKLFHFFVWDEPAPAPSLLAPLVEQFRSDDLRVRGVLSRLLSSRLFYSSHAMGRKVRMPVELAIGWLRGLDATANLTWLAPRLSELGQTLFFPPSVKGWEGGRSWVNSATIVGRTNVMIDLFADMTTRFAGGPLGQYLERQGITDPADSMDWLTTQLLAVPLSTSTRHRILHQSDGTMDETSWRGLLGTLAALPESQLA